MTLESQAPPGTPRGVYAVGGRAPWSELADPFRIMAAREVTTAIADRWAMRLSSHPGILWADLWDPEP